MRKNGKIKVLTLGWEFPPLAVGGLGPAFYGLSTTVSRFVDNTIFLPKALPSFHIVGAQIIGFNQLEVEAINSGQLNVSEFLAMDHMPGPYPMSLPGNLNMDPIEAEESYRLFNEQDIYGHEVLRKVQAYAELALQLASQMDFDVIHAHDWVTFPAALKIKKSLGKPTVLHVHSLETDRVHPDVKNEVYQIELACMRAADRIMPVSQFTGQNIVAYYGIDPSKIVPVHNALDDLPVNVKHVAHRYKSILFLGRVTHQKGPETLFKTVRRLVEYIPTLKVFVAGTGDQLEHLKWMVQEAGLQDVFTFTGFIKKSEVHELMSYVDAYFMPSVSEPFGLSAVEAAQFDIPCIISNQSGVAEVLHNALKADFWDIDRLANYLYAALHYQGIRQTMVENTRRDLKQINWMQSAKQVIRVYKEVVQ